MVHLPIDRPRLRVDRRKAGLKSLQGHAAGGDCRRAVIGRAVLQRGPLEGDKISEELQQSVIRPGCLTAIHSDRQDCRRECDRAQHADE